MCGRTKRCGTKLWWDKNQTCADKTKTIVAGQNQNADKTLNYGGTKTRHYTLISSCDDNTSFARFSFSSVIRCIKLLNSCSSVVRQALSFRGYSMRAKKLVWSELRSISSLLPMKAWVCSVQCSGCLNSARGFFDPFGVCCNVFIENYGFYTTRLSLKRNWRTCLTLRNKEMKLSRQRPNPKLQLTIILASTLRFFFKSGSEFALTACSTDCVIDSSLEKFIVQPKPKIIINERNATDSNRK